MNKGKKIWNLMKNGGVFILVVAITFRFIFFNTDFKEIVKTVSQVNLLYIWIGILAICLMVLCEAINIRRSLKVFKEDTSLLQCIQYSFVGIFLVR